METKEEEEKVKEKSTFSKLKVYFVVDVTIGYKMKLSHIQ